MENKNSAFMDLSGYAMLAAMLSETTGHSSYINERGSLGNGKQRNPPEINDYRPFNKQDGVLRTIKDYNLIKQGKSKKGIIKQSRIIKRINDWIKSGLLSQTDLN